MKTILILVILFSSFAVAENKKCRCGDYEGGITSYTIDASTGGCCKGSVIGEGATAYFEYSDGAWELTFIQEISGSEAQGICCSNA